MQESLVGCSRYFTNYVSCLRTTSVYLEIIVEVIEFWCLSSNLRLLEPCNVLKISFFLSRFYRLQKEFKRDGRYAAEGNRKGRHMYKPNTLKAESWFNGW